jgi:hypothetical protein
MQELVRERCQFENTIYQYVPPLGALRRLRRAALRFPDRLTARAGQGRESRFTAGEWVRVKDAGAVRATLDARDALRGLTFTQEQWAFCGRTFRVSGSVRRMMTDAGRMRAIARTVALDGVTCGGAHDTGGCGRACPLLFRDEWLEPSSAERADPAPRDARYVTVKLLPAILATLDARGRRDGVGFAPQMARYAGARLAVVRAVAPVAATFWRRPAGDWFVLAGVTCSGESLGADGPCHRGCGLLWHRDWLDFD